MSTGLASVAVVVVLAVSLVWSYWLIRRVDERTSTRARLVREAHEQAEQASALDHITFNDPQGDQ